MNLELNFLKEVSIILILYKKNRTNTLFNGENLTGVRQNLFLFLNFIFEKPRVRIPL